MKKFIIATTLALCAFGAYAENNNAATSKEYVDTELATKQPTVPANGTNVVMTFDYNANDGIGVKQIYDETVSYASQQDSLVTAATANGAIQLAINSEFVCHEWNPTDNTDCWLWDVKQPSQQTLLPNGFTPLEYIEADGPCYFNTTIPWDNVSRFRSKAQQTAVLNVYNRSVLGSSVGTDVRDFYGTAVPGNGESIYWYWNMNMSGRIATEFDISYVNDGYTGIVDGQTTGYTQPRFTGNVQIMNTGSSSHRYFTGRVWYVQLFNLNGKLIFDGFPARRNSNGTVGIYDTVSGTFLTNNGNGNCVAGPVGNIVSVYIPQNVQ